MLSEPPVRPLHIAHLVPSFDSGGMETTILQLVRQMPPARYRHTLVCLEGPSSATAALLSGGVACIGVQGRSAWRRCLSLYRILRSLQPDLVHTRDGGALEAQVVAAVAGVRGRVHGGYAADGQLVAQGFSILRSLSPRFVQHFITADGDWQHRLAQRLGATPERISRIAIGVDSMEFHPRLGPPASVGPHGFLEDHCFVIGSVGRFHRGRDFPGLVRAFIALATARDPVAARLRLMLVGDGPDRPACLDLLERAGLAHRAWLPGQRNDVAQLLRCMDLFVLPGAADGGEHAIVEAMASGLPVIAIRVGCHSELVQTGLTGTLLPPGRPELLTASIADYARLPDLGRRHGVRARQRALTQHSLPAMLRGYMAVYEAVAKPASAAA